MYWSKITIAKAHTIVITDLKGTECYHCVVCGGMIQQSAKVMNVDSYDDDGFRMFSQADQHPIAKNKQTVSPVNGYAHKKCFTAMAVKVRLMGKSFHATNGRYVNKPEFTKNHL